MMKSKDLESGQPCTVPEGYCRAPITSLRVEKLGGYVQISVWVNHGKSGDLVVSDGKEFDQFIATLTRPRYA